MNSKLLPFVLIGVLAGCAAREPRNLTLDKWATTEYHDSGRYDAQFLIAADKARDYLRKRVANSRPGEKLAIVFDIDETVLSNWEYLAKYDYSFDPTLVNQWLAQSRSQPLSPTIALYQEAVQMRVPVFFISGRKTPLHAATVLNLRRVGITKFQGLYLRSVNDTNSSVVPFKTAARQAIADQGYRIVLNIGDQESDLKGGFAERRYKLPNPFYYID